MNIILYLIFLAISFGQLQRISFFDQNINIYLHEFLIVFFIIGWIAINRRSINKKKIIYFAKRDKLIQSILLFCGIIILSLVNDFYKYNFFQNLVGFLYYVRLVTYFLFFFIIYKNKKYSKILIKGVLIFISLTVALSITQYFLYPDLRNIEYLGWDPHYFRALGLFFDTTTPGVIYGLSVIIVSLSVGRRIFPKNNAFKYFSKAVVALLMVLILLTYSRITYISLLISAIYYFIKSINIKRSVYMLILLIFVILLLPRPEGEGVKLERTFSIHSRIKDQKQALSLWGENKILGVGYNRIRYVRPNSTSHGHAGASFSSSYLTILVSSGLLGLGAFLYMFYRFFDAGGKGTQSLLILVLSASLFDNVILVNFVLFVFIVGFTILQSRELL